VVALARARARVSETTEPRELGTDRAERATGRSFGKQAATGVADRMNLSG